MLSGLIAAVAGTLGVTWNNHAESVRAEMVSGNYFETLGVRPAVGRLFGSSDETAPGANPVAVLSFDYWKTHLAEAPVVGKTLLINGTPFTIIGRGGAGISQHGVGAHAGRVCAPDDGAGAGAGMAYLNDRQSYWIDLTGRLEPGVTRRRQRLR